MMPVGTQRRSRKALNQKRTSHVFFSLFFPVRVVTVFLFYFFFCFEVFKFTSRHSVAWNHRQFLRVFCPQLATLNNLNRLDSGGPDLWGEEEDDAYRRQGRITQRYNWDLKRCASRFATHVDCSFMWMKLQRTMCNSKEPRAALCRFLILNMWIPAGNVTVAQRA